MNWVVELLLIVFLVIWSSVGFMLVYLVGVEVGRQWKSGRWWVG